MSRHPIILTASISALFLAASTLSTGCVAYASSSNGDEDVGHAEQAVSGATAFTSEEFAPINIPYGSLMSGVTCRGRYCDAISMIYNDYAGGTPGVSPTRLPSPTSTKAPASAGAPPG